MILILLLASFSQSFGDFKLQDVKNVRTDLDPKNFELGKLGPMQFGFQETVNRTFTVGFTWNQFTGLRYHKYKAFRFFRISVFGI